jgi:N-acetylglucosaminyl-diphospho-decaprenol L-rhamnosyltransferase
MIKPFDVSILIVSWNSAELIIPCVRSIEAKTRNVRHEIIVVDNGSTDGSAQRIRKTFPEVRLIENPENLGFARAVNLALDTVSGRYTFLLNPDILFRNDAASILSRFLDGRPEAGIAGGRLFNSDGSPGVSFGRFPAFRDAVNRSMGGSPNYGIPFDPTQTDPGKVDWISGADLMIRSDFFRELGGLDPSYFFSFEDVDLCLRAARLGRTTYVVPDAEIVHIHPHGFKGSSPDFRIHFYTSEFLFHKKHCRFSFFVFILYWMRWAGQWIKRTVRKRHRRDEYRKLLQGLWSLQKGR